MRLSLAVTDYDSSHTAFINNLLGLKSMLIIFENEISICCKNNRYLTIMEFT